MHEQKISYRWWRAIQILAFILAFIAFQLSQKLGTVASLTVTFLTATFSLELLFWAIYLSYMGKVLQNTNVMEKVITPEGRPVYIWCIRHNGPRFNIYEDSYYLIVTEGLNLHENSLLKREIARYGLNKEEVIKEIFLPFVEKVVKGEIQLDPKRLRRSIPFPRFLSKILKHLGRLLPTAKQ